MSDISDREAGGCCLVVILLAIAIPAIAFCVFMVKAVLLLFLWLGLGSLMTLAVTYLFPVFVLKLVLPFVLVFVLIKIIQISRR